MSKHLSIKLSVIGLTLSALITAFVNPTEFSTQRFDAVTLDAVTNVTNALTTDDLTSDDVTTNVRIYDTVGAATVLPMAVPLRVTPEVTVRDVPRKVRSSFVTTDPYGPHMAVRPTFQVRATGYNSHAAQTDSTPFITATGARTQLGIIAVSRDLLDEEIPYGSLVRLKDLGNFHNGRGYGKHQDFLDAQDVFIVEDTLHWRKQNQIDVWFPTLSQAREWGVRQVELELVRYGREGQSFDEMVVELPEESVFTPRFVARPRGDASPSTQLAQAD